MGKIVLIFLAGIAVIQLIKPIGLPGFTRRSDAWKLALAGLLVMLILIALRPDF